MKKNNIVLVPTDFSEVAEYAIEHGANICKTLSYKLTFLHVINNDTKAKLRKESLSPESINEKLKFKVDEVVKKFGIKADYISKEGSIFTTINEVSKEIGANLVTMGTHGKVGLQKITGSYALKVIESLDIPVIVVQEKSFNEGYKNIVLPIDDTLESKQKVKWITNIAKNFNSTIHIFSMNSSEPYSSNKIKANTLQVKKHFEQNEIKFTQKNAEKASGFTKQILSYAESINGDLIIILTEPDKLLPNIFGTWQEEILFNISKISVMCANPIETNIVVGGL